MSVFDAIWRAKSIVNKLFKFIFSEKIDSHRERIWCNYWILSAVDLQHFAVKWSCSDVHRIFHQQFDRLCPDFAESENDEKKKKIILVYINHADAELMTWDTINTFQRVVVEIR